MRTKKYRLDKKIHKIRGMNMETLENVLIVIVTLFLYISLIFFLKNNSSLINFFICLIILLSFIFSILTIKKKFKKI